MFVSIREGYHAIYNPKPAQVLQISIKYTKEQLHRKIIKPYVISFIILFSNVFCDKHRDVQIFICCHNCLNKTGQEV